MKYSLVVLLFCVSVLHLSNSARILGIVPTPSFSHQVAFQPLWTELSKRGHEVVVCTSDPMNDKTLHNLTEINLKSAYNVLERHNFQEKIRNSVSNPLGFIVEFTKIVEDVYIEELNLPEMQRLIHNESEHFDVVLVEALFPAMLVLGERFKCPTIGILSLDGTFSHHRLMGNPTHPVLYPEFTLPFYGELSFKERVISTLYQLFMDYFRTTIMFERDQRILDTYFNNITTTTRDELEKNMSMLFVNTNPILHGNRPLSANTISFGGAVQMKPPKDLPPDIAEFLDNSKQGAIYFSLGTNVKSKDLADDLKAVFLKTFEKLPFNILWKFESDKLENKPKNVKIVEWLPQQDVLRHPNIKLFITQGGLQSMEEAMFSHVPMIGIPFFGDQVSNVKRMVYKKMGLYLDYKTLNDKILEKSIYEIINNQNYKKQIIKLTDLIKDQPLSGIEKAVWWTEYVIRHKGALHFENPSNKFPFYQQYLIDVYGFLVGIAIIGLYFIYLISKVLVYLLEKIF